MSDDRSGSAPAQTAPYIPWSAFESFLKSFKTHDAMPPQVDRSLMANMSGSTQSQLRGALRFFGLVQDPDDATTERFERTVKAIETSQWPDILAEFAEDYATVLGGVDLERGTRANLEEAFRSKGGVTGSALRKAIRVYLAVLDGAKLKYSPYFKKGKANGGSRQSGAKSTTRKRSRKSSAGAAANSDVPPNDTQPEWSRELTLPLPGEGRRVTMWIPKDISSAEEGIVMMYLTEFLKLHRNREQP